MSSTPPKTYKTVLVTGGAIRLGREVSLYFASQGWDVAVHYNRSEKLALQLKEEMAKRFPHIDVGLYKAELSSEEEIKVLFDQVVHGKNQPIEPSQFQGQGQGQGQGRGQNWF